METDVTSFLESANINYKVKPHKTDVFTCEDAARERNVRLSQIVKCMIGKDVKGNLHVMLIPGDRTLKIKLVRALAGSIKITLVQPDEIAKELGLVVGAISPTQLIGKAKFYFDNTIFNEEFVDISSGKPDAGVELLSEDLFNVLGGMKCDIISKNR